MASTLHIKNELGQLALVYSFIEQETSCTGLDESVRKQIKLALEEAVTNVILYAYPDRKDQDIRIDLNCSGGMLKIEITDTGLPFNPLERETPDLTLSVEERPVGGLGIFLVTQLMDDVRYRRLAGKNVLTMIKNIC